MTRYVSCFVIFFLFFQLLQAQKKKKIDSLVNVLNSAQSDTTRVNTLSALAYNISSTDTVQAFEYINEGIRLANKINYKKGLALCYNSEGVIYKNLGKYNLSINFHQKALAFFIELNDKKNTGRTYNHIGTAYSEQGNYPKALENYQKALEVYLQLNDKTGTAKCYNLIGLVYKDQGNYTKAIECYMKALKIREEMNDKKGIMACYSNIGEIQNKQGNYEKAIEYFDLTLNIAQELKDKKGLASCYNNLGNVFMKVGGEKQKKDSIKAKPDQDKAIEYFNKAISILEITKDKKSIAGCYNNIGFIYKYQNNYNKGIDFFLKSLRIFEELNSKEDISTVCANIADIKNKIKQYNEGIKYSERSLNIAKEIGSWDKLQFAYEKLSNSYKGLENFKEAMSNFELYTKYNDSIFNKEKNKQFAEMESKYENEKKKKEIVLQKTEIKQQRTQKYAFIGGFVLMLVLAVVILRSYREKKKANILLEIQKKIIEEKNEELYQTNAEIAAQRDQIAQINEDITDSIRYAQRIQKAVLPVLNEEDHIIAPLEMFILFKPKDIVSGDFYFIARRKQWVLIAAADCTGHGVPGAFMSMLGISFLNEIVAKEDVQTASHVLNELRRAIIHSLQQKGTAGEQQDGMDIGFTAVNVETNELQFAGANNPLYVIASRHPETIELVEMIEGETTKQSQNDRTQDCFAEVRNDDHYLIELKPDKMPVGIYQKMDNFTNQTIQLQKGDIFYLLSDGYQDQFGGPKYKKFLSKNLKSLLMANSQQPMAEQKRILENVIVNWMHGFEQIDDITLVGVKV